MNIIETKNLTKNYGKNRGIQDVNISVKEGEIFGFIGPNGAGKSTTIKTLLNFIYPTSGSSKILGMDIVEDSSKIKEYIGYVPSEVRYYEDVKVKDIIKYSKSFYSKIDQEYVDKICNELELDMNKKMGELSLGNKKKVSIAQALIHSPKLLILDEPTNGLDPLMQNKLFNILLKEKEKGNTVFLSSHNLTEVQNLCDRACVIKDGKIIDIIEIEKEISKLSLKITLTSSDITKEIILGLSSKLLSNKENSYTFTYSKDIDTLIKEISKFKIDELLIEKENLEDTFLDYYKNKEIE
ncbi:ABC transporter ATP-binding protein [Romboutsia lituseburensis]|uniref:ABC-2 type transport system ATP-binding protein n=1 Tax=Romboutsia lituseburensis DSM 797 TaxID=1121325 RepID=A0A1G9M204_9FIRM|nr:ABC transporter ATP-binding protein [Romboutsia lituseburensis]CEH34672.1 Bacitracin transport ATP-binding protein BcrA [Romboutsia lituseburensis]SDL67745.1 ABC-2 type transport system ATP-binding protein [Romboutsia lituseburensis DSM 797]